MRVRDGIVVHFQVQTAGIRLGNSFIHSFIHSNLHCNVHVSWLRYCLVVGKVALVWQKEYSLVEPAKAVSAGHAGLVNSKK